MASLSYFMAQSAGVKGDMEKIEAFHNGCLGKICQIFWPNEISNVELYKKTGCNSVVLEIKRRCLRWLGHILRMGQEGIPKVALRWTRPGKRKRGRSKATWRRTVRAELADVNLSWGEAQSVARDRTRWKNIVEALFLQRDDKNDDDDELSIESESPASQAGT